MSTSMAPPRPPPRPPPAPPFSPPEPYLDPVNVPEKVMERMMENLEGTASAIRLIEEDRRRIAGRPSRYFHSDAPGVVQQNTHLLHLAALCNTLVTEARPYAEELRGSEILERIDELANYVEGVKNHFEKMRVQYTRQAGFAEAVGNCPNLRKFLAGAFGFAGTEFGNSDSLQDEIIDWKERKQPEGKKGRKKKRRSKQKK
ncbi:hypothetical protein BP6252_03147 [Coleophoma cylindrospora]|uniref:Uncharacterized protein n=1 Tax=Coleophoma cylindrospora TaxID=1849047 RepID=A0A3D8S6V0_9HELO|nr:hypothetical protein BP6252_03147 [Coleophoma cylindrospora]